LARIASGLVEPDTERTLRSEGKHLLHLRLAEQEGGEVRNILFSDIYGEAFRHAADIGEECRKFTVLKRADHVAVLVDGKKAADRKERQSAFASADTLIGQCLDCGMFDRESSVQVVVTKWDLIAGDAAKEQFVGGKLDWLNGRYAARVGSLTSHKTSLRSRAGSGISLGHGVGELLGKWTQIRWRLRSIPAAGARQFYTEFDRSAVTRSSHSVGEPTGG
jgi:hypothetical protein